MGTKRKERPVLFNGEMVRAILAGKKTQTRRPVKQQPEHLSPVRPYHRPNGDWCWVLEKTGMGSGVTTDGFRSPLGKVGDLLYVRETFQPLWIDGFDMSLLDYSTGAGYYINYPATDGKVEWVDYDTDDEEITTKCKPSIHMPKWASRITLEITGVRVERVQEISEGDARAEGANPANLKGLDAYLAERMDCKFKPAFSRIWDDVYDTWDDDPWVWVYEFKVCDA